MPGRRPVGTGHRLRRSAGAGSQADTGRRRDVGGRRAPRAGRLLAGGLRRRRRGLRRVRAEPALPQRRRRGLMAGARRAARASLPAELELPAQTVDVARPLDRAEPARRGAAPGRDRAGRPHALDRRRRDLARPPAGRAARRPLARLAPARARTRVRGGRRRVGLEQGRRRHLAPGRRRPRPQLHVVGGARSGRCRRLVPEREHRPVRRARRKGRAGADLPARGRPAVGGGRRPRPARCRTHSRSARTAVSSPRSPTGASSRAAGGKTLDLRGDRLTELHALAAAA